MLWCVHTQEVMGHWRSVCVRGGKTRLSHEIELFLTDTDTTSGIEISFYIVRSNLIAKPYLFTMFILLAHIDFSLNHGSTQFQTAVHPNIHIQVFQKRHSSIFSHPNVTPLMAQIFRNMKIFLQLERVKSVLYQHHISM